MTSAEVQDIEKKKKRSNIPALLFGCNSNLSQFTNTVIGGIHTKYVSSKTEQMNGVEMLACSYSKKYRLSFSEEKVKDTLKTGKYRLSGLID